MATTSIFCVSFLFMVCLQMDLDSAITININPETMNEDAASSTVDVTCKLDNAESDAKDLMMLKIARKGEKAIVWLHRNNTLTYSAGNKEEFPAKGNVAKDVTDTTLTMTITTPNPEDGGAYTCYVYYINWQGSLTEHKTSSYLTVEDPALQLLNKTVKRLKDKVEQGNKKIDNLSWKDTMDKVKIADLDRKIDKNSDDIQDLLKKDDDVDDKLKKMEEKMMDQIKKMSNEFNTKTIAHKTRVANLESTVLHQVETIKDLTEKLAEFEKTVKDLTKRIKEKDDSSDGTKDDTNNLKETVELITKTVNDISDTVDENKESVNKITSAANIMTQKIDASTKKVSDVEKKLTNLEDDTKRKLRKLTDDDLDNDFLNLQDKVREHTKQIKDLREKAYETEETGKKLKSVTEVLAQQINRDKKEGQVAFHAMTKKWSLPVKLNEPIKFYEVTLNQGKGYDPATGVFTAPKAGIYAFHVYIQVPCYGCKIEATIEVDKKILARYTGGSRYTYDQHSISAVAKLRFKSMVKVIATYIGKHPKKIKWGLGGIEKCGFSGFLVAT